MTQQREKDAENTMPLFPETAVSPIAKDLMNRFTVEHLRAIEWTFTGERLRDQSKKQDLCDRIAALVTFAGKDDYIRFYSSLPKILQRLLDRGIFRDEVDCMDSKTFGGGRLIVMDNDRYSRTISMNPGERIHCFVPESERFIRLVEPFQSIFRQFADHPAEWEFEPVTAPQGTVWTNEREMAENLPLLIAEAGALITYNNRAARIKKKCLKNELKTLRARSGLESFPLSAETGLDPIDIFIPIVAALHTEMKNKPPEIDTWIKSTLGRFFFEEKVLARTMPALDDYKGSMFELYALGRHLGEESWGDVFGEFPRPPSRSTLHWLLGEIGPSGAWYRVDRLLSTLEARGKTMSFLSRERERRALFFRANELAIPDVTLNDDYDGKLDIIGPLHREVVYRPLLKAYCYLLALFGIVEISETSPAMPVMRKGKPATISAYDALECVRVTDYGRWFLGFSARKPERMAEIFEALADKELLLVTFRGKSLERKLFLEEISDPLGVERFRISEVSFTRGCRQAEDVKARIARFAELIEREPSPRWQEFFKSILERVGKFSRPDRALLFDLSGMNPSIGATIFGDQRLADIAIRAEGNRIVIPESRYRQFIKLLGEHGFITPETS